MIGGISTWQLVILLVIIVLIFGTKRLRAIGSDLGSALKGFRKGIGDDADSAEPEELTTQDSVAADQSQEKESTSSSTNVEN